MPFNEGGRKKNSHRFQPQHRTGLDSRSPRGSPRRQEASRRRCSSSRSRIKVTTLRISSSRPSRPNPMRSPRFRRKSLARTNTISPSLYRFLTARNMTIFSTTSSMAPGKREPSGRQARQSICLRAPWQIDYSEMRGRARDLARIIG